MVQNILEQNEALLREVDAIKTAAAKENRSLSADELQKVANITKRSDELSQQVEAYSAMSKAEKDAAMRSAAFNVSPAGKPDYSKKDEQDRNQFSLARTIQTIVTQGMNAKFVGADAEAIKEGFSESRSLPNHNQGFFISADYLRRGLKQSRAYNVATDGSDIVQTDVAQAIGALFAPNWLDALGVTRLTGLQGNLRLPRHVKGSNPAFKTENAAAGAYSSTFESKLLTPKRLPTYVDVSRQEMLQVPYVEQFVIGDLTKQLNNLVESAIINGASDGPTGIIGDTDISLASSTSNALTYLNLRSFERTLKNKNAFQGSLGYLSNPDVEYKLQTTAKLLSGQSSSTYPVSLMEDSGKINGLPAYFTKNVSNTISTDKSALILGNWSDLVTGQWSGLEILVDPYTQATEGYVRVQFAMYFDAVVRRPDSFLICKDITSA